MLNKLTLEQAATISGISVRTLRAAAKDNMLDWLLYLRPAKKRGGQKKRERGSYMVCVPSFLSWTGLTESEIEEILKNEEVQK